MKLAKQNIVNFQVQSPKNQKICVSSKKWLRKHITFIRKISDFSVFQDQPAKKQTRRKLLNSIFLDFQLYLPPDRAAAFDGAETSFSFPETSQNLATCLWVSFTHAIKMLMKVGEINVSGWRRSSATQQRGNGRTCSFCFRQRKGLHSRDNGLTIFQNRNQPFFTKITNRSVLLSSLCAIQKDNSVLLSNKSSTLDFAFPKIDLRDFRWHQICTTCSSNSCTVYLDGQESSPQPFSLSAFSSVNVNFGYASGFQGKIQKFRISNEESPIESATACGAPVKQLSNALSVRKNNLSRFSIS